MELGELFRQQYPDQEHIAYKINYNSCVDVHKNDATFSRLEWRVFLGRDQELWKVKRETLLLIDDKGKLVDSLSY